MDDLQIKTHVAQSEANGMFNRMQEIKVQREKLKGESDLLVQKLIKHIEQNGQVLAFKNDVPHILTIGTRISTKLDKAALAADLEVNQKELSPKGIASLVEKGKLTSQMIETHTYQESEVVLKARKATKNDLKLIFGGRG